MALNSGTMFIARQAGTPLRGAIIFAYTNE